MALHRKQRGVADALPQYVRIPTSRATPGASSSLGGGRHERQHLRSREREPVVNKGGSGKISSLQLRACFLLCVLLYFGAIYFADEISSLGKVVGSEQTSQSFFVHSTRARGVRKSGLRTGKVVVAAVKDEMHEQQEKNRVELEAATRNETLDVAGDPPSQPLQAQQQPENAAPVLEDKPQAATEHKTAEAREEKLVESIDDTPKAAERPKDDDAVKTTAVLDPEPHAAQRGEPPPVAKATPTSALTPAVQDGVGHAPVEPPQRGRGRHGTLPPAQTVLQGDVSVNLPHQMANSPSSGTEAPGATSTAAATAMPAASPARMEKRPEAVKAVDVSGLQTPKPREVEQRTQEDEPAQKP